MLAEPGEEIGLIHLSERVTGGRLDAAEWRPRGRLREAVETVEREVIQRSSETHQGNKTHMAEELGISRWTLLQKMRAYGLETGSSDGDG